MPRMQGLSIHDQSQDQSSAMHYARWRLATHKQLDHSRLCMSATVLECWIFSPRMEKEKSDIFSKKRGVEKKSSNFVTGLIPGIPLKGNTFHVEWKSRSRYLIDPPPFPKKNRPNFTPYVFRIHWDVNHSNGSPESKTSWGSCLGRNGGWLCCRLCCLQNATKSL